MQNRQEWNAKKDTAVFHSIGMEDKIVTAPLHSVGMECKINSTFSLDMNGMQNRSGMQQQQQQQQQTVSHTIGMEDIIGTAPFHSIGMECKIDTALFHSIGMECKIDRSGIKNKIK